MRISVLIIGILLYLWAAYAVAAQSAIYGPDWSLLARAFAGIIVTVLSAYLLGLERRVTRIEATALNLRRELDREYLTKLEVSGEFAEVRRDFRLLNRRLDLMHVPRVEGLHDER